MPIKSASVLAVVRSSALLFGAGAAAASGDLNGQQMTLLNDSGSWEYIKMSDSGNGIQTEHSCFDGKPHPDTCSATLTLTSDNAFTQRTIIHGQTVERRGTYELSSDQITFSDEFGTQDGPYTITIDAQAKSMIMEMSSVKIELQLYKEYKKSLDNRNRNRKQ